MFRCMRSLLRACVDAACICEPHCRRDLCEEAYTLLQGIHQRHMDVRHIDGERNAGQSRAGAHVDEGLRRAKERRLVRRQAVDDVLDRHVLRRGECGEVHARVPVDEHIVVNRKLRDLHLGQYEPRLGGACRKEVLKDRHVCPLFHG